MSLVTTCPACSTSFFVTQQQLATHKGDLRCGKCNHVFNAINRVTEIKKPIQPEIEEPLIELDETPIPDVLETNTEIQSNEPEISVGQILAEAAMVEAANPQPAKETFVSENPIPAQADITAAEVIAVTTTQPQPIPNFLSDSALKSKLADKKVKGKPHTLLFSLLSVLLIVTIALQSTYFMRSSLASKYPALKPALLALCSVLQCEIPLPRHIELWAIDDSDLQEDADHVGLIHLSTTMTNNAAFAQDYPLLELTLTDINDKPMLRRAFLPSEYLPTGTNISAGLAAGEEVHIKLDLTASGEPVAGYRVFVAY